MFFFKKNSFPLDVVEFSCCARFAAAVVARCIDSTPTLKCLLVQLSLYSCFLMSFSHFDVQFPLVESNVATIDNDVDAKRDAQLLQSLMNERAPPNFDQLQTATTTTTTTSSRAVLGVLWTSTRRIVRAFTFNATSRHAAQVF